MKDYGYDSRQALIASTFDLTTKKGRKEAFQYWISKGHSESAASNASGYHHLEEYDSWFGRFVLAMVVGMVATLMFILANSVYAAANLEGSAGSEAAFIRCLNGEAVTLSDGTRWGCMRLMEVRK